MTKCRSFFALLFSILASLSLCAADTGGDSAQVEADKKALAPIIQYVGGWRGAGLPKDGGKDGWSEDADWRFDLKGGHAALVFSAEKGKYYTAGRIEPGEKKGTFKFIGTLPDGKTKDVFAGEIATVEKGDLEKGDLVFENTAPGAERPARIIFAVKAKGDRLVLDVQRKSAGDRYANLSEIGYTRKGSGFGKQADAHECIITGGKGTISVSYKGQTYWVCCSGCKEAFEANPEKEIAAYKKRKEEEKKNM